MADLAATSDAVVVLEREVKGAEALLKRLKPARDVSAFESVDGYPAYRVFGKSETGDHLNSEIYALAREQDWPLRELRRDVRTLEMVFNELALASEPATSGEPVGEADLASEEEVA